MKHFCPSTCDLTRVVLWTTCFRQMFVLFSEPVNLQDQDSACCLRSQCVQTPPVSISMQHAAGDKHPPVESVLLLACHIEKILKRRETMREASIATAHDATSTLWWHPLRSSRRALHRKDLEKARDNEGSIRLKLQLSSVDLVHSRTIVDHSQHLSKDEERGRQMQRSVRPRATHQH